MELSVRSWKSHGISLYINYLSFRLRVCMNFHKYLFKSICFILLCNPEFLEKKDSICYSQFITSYNLIQNI